VEPVISTIFAAGGALDPRHLIELFGNIGLLLIVFAESGLFFGFFLPGDSLLFTAGLLSAQGDLGVWPIYVLLPLLFIAAVAGDQVGYAFGNKVGPALFKRPDSRLFKQEHIERATRFFEKHGAKTILLARFVPIVRTFAPILAGVGRMPYRTFLKYNVVGGFLWAVGVTSLGFFLGKQFPELENYLLPVIIVIVALSLIPIAVEVIRTRMSDDDPEDEDLTPEEAAAILHKAVEND
jgi:membrane-associated protein